MSAVFADTSYWLALLNRRDQLHFKAQALSKALDGTLVFTSEMVFAEFLNDCSGRGWHVREKAVRWIERLRQDADFRIVEQSSALFDEALLLYSRRSDQTWSLTDCASFLIMERHRMTQALTHDRHFQQAGFRALLR